MCTSCLVSFTISKHFPKKIVNLSTVLSIPDSLMAFILSSCLSICLADLSVSMCAMLSVHVCVCCICICICVGVKHASMAFSIKFRLSCVYLLCTFLSFPSSFLSPASLSFPFIHPPHATSFPFTLPFYYVRF